MGGEGMAGQLRARVREQEAENPSMQAGRWWEMRASIELGALSF